MTQKPARQEGTRKAQFSNLVLGIDLVLLSHLPTFIFNHILVNTLPFP